MPKNSKIIVAGLFAACSLLPSGAFAQSDDGDALFNIETLSCWEFVTMPNDDATYVSLILYGYASGKAGKAEQTGNMIKTVIEGADGICADNPDMPAIDAFKLM